MEAFPPQPLTLSPLSPSLLSVHPRRPWQPLDLRLPKPPAAASALGFRPGRRVGPLGRGRIDESTGLRRRRRAAARARRDARGDGHPGARSPAADCDHASTLHPPLACPAHSLHRRPPCSPPTGRCRPFSPSGEPFSRPPRSDRCSLVAGSYVGQSLRVPLTCAMCAALGAAGAEGARAASRGRHRARVERARRRPRCCMQRATCNMPRTRGGRTRAR